MSDYLLLVARTTPRSEVEKKTEGITLFLIDLKDGYDQGAIQTEPIDKTALNLSHSFEVWIQDIRVPASSVVGTVGEGFYHLLDGLNEQRLVIAAECLGHGRTAVERGVDYANERVVFDRQIGKNQTIQHPLAEAYMRAWGAKHVTYGAAAAATDFDRKVIGVRANTVKYLAAETAYEDFDAAAQTHGGFGVAQEYDVERLFRDARFARVAPVTQELALNYVAETALGLPRSY